MDSRPWLSPVTASRLAVFLASLSVTAGQHLLLLPLAHFDSQFVSPSGLWPSAFSPVADATGRDLPPSGLTLRDLPHSGLNRRDLLHSGLKCRDVAQG